MSYAFHTTCWTEVLQARGQSTQASEALCRLCENYYSPIIAYLQRAESYDREAATEVAHEFFSELLSRDSLAHLDQAKGRFRSYLLGALKNFLSRKRQERSAIKRGGDVLTLISLEDGTPLLDEETFPPDSWFDRQWAVSLLQRALDRVEHDSIESGQHDTFLQLSPWLTGDDQHGDQAALAEQLGIPSNTLKSTIHRLRKQFRKAVKTELATTISDDYDLDAEMADLFTALRCGK